MTHEDRHRGRHPGDDRLFAAKELPALRAATADLSWLLTRGYAEQSAIKIVGDRHELTARQRQAVSRCTCSDAARDDRLARRITRDELVARDNPTLAIDGFNCLITIESALSHGIVLRGRDGALRDLASVHGTYRQVAETAFAVEMLGRHLHGPREPQPHATATRTDTHMSADPRPPLAVTWYLDRPVANSGRLRALLLEIAERRGWPWTCELVNNPDAILIRPEHPVVASSDAFILDHCARWFDPLGSLLAVDSSAASAAHVPASGPILAARPGLWLLDLGSPSPSSSGIGET